MFVLASCSNNNELADAYGNFKAKEIILSSEVAGKLITKNFEEGASVTPDRYLAIVDTTQLVLQKEEISTLRSSIAAKKANINAQIEVLRQQMEIARTDQQRIQKMFNDDAATKKQLDDIKGKVDVIEKTIVSIQTNFQSINAELVTLEAKERKVNDLIHRSTIYPPSQGIVLQSYVEKGELVSPVKPLLKMANLNSMELKAYISGSQLSTIKLNQEVRVKIDGSDQNMMEYGGRISWISSEAEFTPKNIQTKEERISQVYAFKVLVENDGAIKINMPAEVFFKP